MSATLVIDPVTRLEGHLALKVEVENGRVARAYSKGEMFRGFENIMAGRSPLDAQQITQRICGVCPISHGTASILAQDAAYGVTPTDNGRILRNLILAANYIQSHIVHFYVLSALDFVDIAAITSYTGGDPVLTGLRKWVEAQLAAKMVYPAVPFLPRYQGEYLPDAGINHMAIRHYLQALEMRRLSHQMVALFGGKVPHAAALVPGGVTERVTVRALATYQAKAEKLLAFITDAYIPDVVAVAKAFPQYTEIGKGCGNFLVYGAFPQSDREGELLFPRGIVAQGALKAMDPGKIAEYVRYAKFDDQTTGKHPSVGQTVAKPHKEGAYSWLKAPRYDGQVMEVGPLARVLVAYHKKSLPRLNQRVDALLAALGIGADKLDSVLGRHAARALECQIVAEAALEWVKQLKPNAPAFRDFKIPDVGQGMGLMEAPRGALGHWIDIAGGKVKNYQCVVPTTWNCSPRDDQGVPGAVEQAVAHTPVADPKNPIEVARVVRSFDPCLACAVH